MNKIINKYKVFDYLNVKNKRINDNKKFIFELYEVHDDKYRLSINMEGFYIGIYSLKYNLWSWGNNSETIDKSMVKNILYFKEKMLKKKIINNFINNNYTILTTDEFIKVINVMKNNIKNDIFIVKHNNSLYVLLSNNIYINNNF